MLDRDNYYRQMKRLTKLFNGEIAMARVDGNDVEMALAVLCVRMVAKNNRFNVYDIEDDEYSILDFILQSLPNSREGKQLYDNAKHDEDDTYEEVLAALVSSLGGSNERKIEDAVNEGIMEAVDEYEYEHYGDDEYSVNMGIAYNDFMQEAKTNSEDIVYSYKDSFKDLFKVLRRPANGLADELDELMSTV